ncbi:sarcosine oxidase subunit beta [Sphingomonas oleivorans]|uniref:Sarcosine oxidase subunit beta n=1 Tax=Sphingomonas oleivorans TaxID=1735121 RepID=A0A2T5FZK1_9SPHN|nr:FAD-dependent oxidoreductase [Sphingomonas oleivorans]PTQ12133.1 sarcosine oxidase subunit beta [Sphingomonas oleivorans]
MMQADIIIVGGGIMGASAAFFLRRRGKSVILLERGLVGQQASGVNFGNVRRQGRYLQQLPLANRSRAIWDRLPELIGEDCEFVASGHLRVCYTREQADKMEAYSQDARDYGLDLEMLSSNALRARFPYLGRETIAGCYDPSGGHANPRLTAPAIGRAARRAGADVREEAEVVGIAKAGDDFVVEVKGQGELRAPMLLITAGAWGGKLSALFGEPVPLAVHGPQMTVTEPLPYRIAPTIGVSTPHLHETVYFRQVKRGNIICGGFARGPASNETNRATVLPEAILGQMEQLRRVMPGFANVSTIRSWSGIESYLPDDVPIMGPSATTPGLYYAFGFCGAGFQIGPGVGDVMAELIATGATTTPIAQYGISRFASLAP